MRLDERASDEILRLERYLAGECTPEEMAEVRLWTGSVGGDASSLDRIAEAFKQERGLPGFDADKAYAALYKRLAPAAAQPVRNVRQREAVHSGWSRWRSVWYGAAASVLAVTLVVLGWAGGEHGFGRHVPAAMARYATANGQRGTVTLTDGSTVMLNVGSQLDVPADYATNRTVRLVGEALITVSHRAGSQFTVLTGPTVTRVLGTSFAVRRYDMDTVTTIAVRDGKVAVDSAIVTAGRMIQVGSRGVTHIRLADASQFSFAAGVLTLGSMTLSQAIPELDRWYDADIRLGDPALAAKPIVGGVTAGSLADLTERLTVLFDVRVVRDGRVLTLYPR